MIRFSSFLTFTLAFAPLLSGVIVRESFLVNKGKDPTYLLGQCEGDCDRDSDCVGRLKCFFRDSSKEKVPGCQIGGTGDVPIYDYCYDPDAEYPLVSRGPGPNKLLGRCEGDCDQDSDCDEGLKCFGRDSSKEKVPGCLIGGTGDVPTYDYCSCWGDGTRPKLSWDDCCNPVEWWPGKFRYACGSEPCWAKGTFCGWGTTCKNCCRDTGSAFFSFCQ
jgi:hypothetical protein